MSEHRRLAEDFLNNQKQFHLGGLLTEQPHPITADFSRLIKAERQAGINNFLQVDQDIVRQAPASFAAAGCQKLLAAIVDSALAESLIVFSGCGATGRLAVLLETMWRRFWQRAAQLKTANSDRWRRRSQRVVGLITGGDRALIKSVENFEDYQSFGYRQVTDVGISDGDLMIAISEGGETSSVIGSAWAAIEQKARLFFVFNNPADYLIANFERCRQLLERKETTAIELCSGPMALTGSTRLQATTFELLFIGRLLEQAIERLLEIEQPDYRRFFDFTEAVDPVGSFADLLRQLNEKSNCSQLAALIDWESEIYRDNGLVTYFADSYMLDIFADTTERTPTYNLPPFKPAVDANPNTADSWSFVKGLFYPTDEQWQNMLLRPPRPLNWRSQDYQQLAPETESYQTRPPDLTLGEIYRYRIGNEDIPARYGNKSDRALLFHYHDDENEWQRWSVVREQFLRQTRNWQGGAVVAINPKPENEQDFFFHLRLPSTPLKIYKHLAVKLIFNTLANGVMAMLGRINGNWMIQVTAGNKKLYDRAIRLISGLGNVSYRQACYAFFAVLERQDRFPAGENGLVPQALAEIGANNDKKAQRL